MGSLVTLLGVSLFVVVLDQFTKYEVLHSLKLNEPVAVLPGYLYLTYIQNPGTAFGFMSNMQAAVRIPFFVTVTIVAGFIVYTYQRMMPPERWFSRIALGLIWGGALGNFVDRLLYGKVIDFIEVRHLRFPWIFNVADSCITIGITLLLLEHFFRKSGSEPV